MMGAIDKNARGGQPGGADAESGRGGAGNAGGGAAGDGAGGKAARDKRGEAATTGTGGNGAASGRGGAGHAGSPLLGGLNPEQARAVRHVDGPLLILAGAGSGKTRVLVHRIAHLIHEAGVPPWSILAITFTNKAAREMKSRVEALLPSESASIWISTFHTACLRILRRSIDRLGFTSSFMISDSDDQLALVKECVRELDLNDKMYVPKSVLDQIGRAKDELIGPERFRAMSGSDFRAAKISDVYALYQAKLKKSNALDFDDIIMMAAGLLEEHADL
ncbi:MAG: UvrD-helicase domain-containing protein, partial [Clostridiales bacterium]|nr:UvrD-helicase domain-containing protein [Clostridiales bacterium]